MSPVHLHARQASSFCARALWFFVFLVFFPATVPIFLGLLCFRWVVRPLWDRAWHVFNKDGDFFHLHPSNTDTDSTIDSTKLDVHTKFQPTSTTSFPVFLPTGQVFRPSPIRQISILSLPVRSARPSRSKQLKTVAPPVVMMDGGTDSEPRPEFSVPPAETRRLSQMVDLGKVTH